MTALCGSFSHSSHSLVYHPQPNRSEHFFLRCKASRKAVHGWPLREKAENCPGNEVAPCRSRAIRSELAAGATDLVALGRTPIQVSPLGIGTLQWGDPRSGYGEQYDEAGLAEAYDLLVQGDINFFDTAEVYGYQNIKEGQSAEQLVGRFCQRAASSTARLPPVVATKFFTIPWTKLLVGGGWRLGRDSMVPALRESLQRMGKEQVDLWQIHFPFPTFSNPTLMEGLKEAVDLGLTRAVGVSNYSRGQMEEAHRLLAASGIPLASNQVRYSLLSRAPAEEGLLQSAQDLGVSVIAYSPLATGLLTDKALTRRDRPALKLQPLLKLMASVGAQHGGKTVTQVALNYLICKGAIPIPGCKSVEQARGHLGVLGWRLDADEVASLEGKAQGLNL